MELPQAVDLGRETLLLAIKLSLPLLAVSFAVGLLISVFQAATQLHDSTIAFVPRLLITALAILFLLPWGLSELAEFSVSIITRVPGSG